MAQIINWGYYLNTYTNQPYQIDEDSFVAFYSGTGSSASTNASGRAIVHSRDRTSVGGPTWYYPVGYSNYNLSMQNRTYAPTEEDPKINYMVIDCQRYPDKFFTSSATGLRINFWRYNGQNASAFQGNGGYVYSMLENLAVVPFTRYGIEGKTRINYHPGMRKGAGTNMGLFDSDEVMVRPNLEEYIMIGACHPRWNSSPNYGAPQYIRHPGDDSPYQDNDEIYPEGSPNREFAGNAVFYYAARARAETNEDIKPYRKQPPKTLTLRTFWRKPMDNAIANLVEGEPSTVTVTYDPDTWGTQQDEQGNSYWRNADLTFTNYTLGARPAEAGPDWMPISRVRITSSLEPETCTIQGNFERSTRKYHYIEFSPMEQVYYRNSNDVYSQPNGYDDIDLKYYETRDYTNQSGSYDTRDLTYSRDNSNYHISGSVFLCTGTSITVPMDGRYRVNDNPDLTVWSYSFASWDGYTSSIKPTSSYNLWSSFDPYFYFSSKEKPYPRPAGVSADVMKDAAVFNYNSWYPAERGSFLNYCPYRNGSEPYKGSNNYRAPFANPVIIDNKAYTWTLNYQKQYILVTVDLGEELSIEVEVRDELPKKLTDEMPLFKILTEGKTREGLYYPEPQMFLYESAGKRHIERKNSAYYWVQAFSGNGQTGGDRTTRVPDARNPYKRYYHGWPLPIEPVTFVRASRVDGKTIRSDTYGAGTSYYANVRWAQPPITRGSEYFRDIEFGGWDYHYFRGQHRVFIFDYKDVGYGEPIPLKLNQRDDGLGIHGGPGRLGYFGQNGGWSSRLKNGGSW